MAHRNGPDEDSIRGYVLLSVEVIPSSRSAFLAALDLDEARLDKGYSLTDCISMNAMRERGLFEVLANDAHFRQQGFSVLCAPAA